MADSDFGSAFQDSAPASQPQDEPLRITPGDIEQLDVSSLEPVGPSAVMRIEVVSPQQLASERYGVLLTAPEPGEEIFCGVVRNPESRTEEEDYYPLFSSEPRRRQHQIFTFEIEIPDLEGNPVDYIPVEVRGQQISGLLLTDGSPVAAYGSRDHVDGVVRTHKVLNLRNRSSPCVTVRKDVCFVATAVYGDIEAPQVVVLRRFRDRHLMPRRWGRWLVRAYYRRGPALARWLVTAPRYRAMVRAVLDLVAEKLPGGSAFR